MVITSYYCQNKKTIFCFIKKGRQSGQFILAKCTRILNIEGVNLSLNQLANKFGISRGMISHHFNTKNALFIAIARDYERELGAINKNFEVDNEVLSFDSFKKRYAIIMDHQFAYRCAMIYIVCSGHNEPALSKHILETCKENEKKFIRLLHAMVHLDMLTEEILEKDNLEFFIYDFINHLTTWVLDYNLYKP
jgi:AcrR family transcriptional regulator